jgi:hypothetical protein
MSDLIELNDGELMMVAGGRTVGPITIQTNVNAGAQVGVGVAVLSPGAHVNVNNISYTVQINAAAGV